MAHHRTRHGSQAFTLVPYPHQGVEPLDMLRELEIRSAGIVCAQGNGGAPLYFWIKRWVDVVLSTVLLILSAPLLLVIAVLIKLDSRGSVIFTQERVGARRVRYGERIAWEVRNFRVYKFRSMVRDADPTLHQVHIKAFVEGRLDPLQAGNVTIKLTNDARVTRVGRVLRRTSLDELPQLVNVLKGEMSLIGPRPVPPYEVAGYQSWHRERLAALPGITGLWQVEGRGRVPFDEMVRMDIAYVRARSLLLDIRILFRTLPAVLSAEGAH